jgi:hypothetical protein
MVDASQPCGGTDFTRGLRMCTRNTRPTAGGRAAVRGAQVSGLAIAMLILLASGCGGVESDSGPTERIKVFGRRGDLLPSRVLSQSLPLCV